MMATRAPAGGRRAAGSCTGVVGDGGANWACAAAVAKMRSATMESVGDMPLRLGRMKAERRAKRNMVVGWLPDAYCNGTSVNRRCYWRSRLRSAIHLRHL